MGRENFPALSRVASTYRLSTQTLVDLSRAARLSYHRSLASEIFLTGLQTASFNNLLENSVEDRLTTSTIGGQRGLNFWREQLKFWG